MTDLSTFQEYYRCTIELTQRKSFQRVMLPLNMSTDAFSPDASVGMEDVFAVHMTESMMNEMVDTCVNSIEELNLRRQDPMLMDLYMKYKMMLNLKK